MSKRRKQTTSHQKTQAETETSASPQEGNAQAGHAENPLEIPSGLAHKLSMRLLGVLLIGFFLIYLKSLLIPLVLAILLAFLLSPTIFRLASWGIPYGLSTVITHLLSLVLISLAIFAFTSTLGPLKAQLPKYRDAMVERVVSGVEWVNGKISNPETQEKLKREINESVLPRAIDQGVKITQSGLSTTTMLLGNFFLTLLLSIFIMLEGHAMRDKITEAYGPQNPLLISLSDIGLDVRAYVVAKTLTSLLTSTCVYFVLWIAEVDFAFFWALLTFPLNFIPTIGAIVASLPPIIIASIDPNLSLGVAATVMISLGVVNGFIGSVVEPNYVGQKVQLSPLVVFLSMLLWGLLWGPVGMILAVPIMVSVKVICSHIKGLEPISILMKG